MRLDPSIKLALEQSKLTHLVICIPVICGEWHIDRGLIMTGAGVSYVEADEVGTDIVAEVCRYKHTCEAIQCKYPCGLSTLAMIDTNMSNGSLGAIDPIFLVVKCHWADMNMSISINLLV